MDTAELRTLQCPSCGAPIHHGDLNCVYCGAAIYAGRATEVAVPALAQAQETIPKMQARIERNPYDGDAYYQLGLACFTLKLYDQAENAFEQARRLLPGVALVHFFSGLAMLRSAEDEFLSIQEFRLRQMHREFETAVELDPNLSEAKPYLDLVEGLRARNREDYAGALAPLNAVVQALPNFGAAWKVLAACYFQIADYHAAIRAGNQAMQLLTHDADVAFLIGSAYTRLDDKDNMEGWARRMAVLRGDPDDWHRIIREFKGQIE